MPSSREAEFEALVHHLLARGALSLGPVSLESELVNTSNDGFDGVLRATLKGMSPQRYVFECKATWTRRTRARALARLRQAQPHLSPLLVAPFWSERDLDELREAGVSAIDVCGNGLLIAPPGLFVLRTGAKKKKDLVPRPSRVSVYDSSNLVNIVPRVFFAQERFPTTTAVLEACHARMMPLGGRPPILTLPTVSKALRELDADLVTERHRRVRLLLARARLLEHLQRGFRLPPASTTFKTRLAPQAAWSALRDLRPDVRFVVTGRGSARLHVGLAGPERLQLYVSDLDRVVSALDAKPTRAFPNLELSVAHDEAPFFDAREHEGILWSSPLQCYLELAHPESTPRERDVAVRLMNRLGAGAPKTEDEPPVPTD